MISGRELTKAKRHELFGVVSGGAASKKMEEWQRAYVERETGERCIKTNLRLNLMTNKMKNIAQPNVHDDGFNYSEDFDGFQYVYGKKILLNFKCVSDSGGSQTRSLREVYWFIHGQLKYALKNPDFFFANILDGDCADAAMKHYRYLVGLPDFKSVKHMIYVGDSKGYPEWIRQLSTPAQTELSSCHTPGTGEETDSTSHGASSQESH